MCPTCGTVLAHAFSPQAERQRLFIRAQIEQGRTKEQIKDALVAEFGEDVLATPRDEGFDLTAYLVPIAAVAIAAIAIALGLLRWRRRPPVAAESTGAERLRRRTPPGSNATSRDTSHDTESEVARRQA